MLAFENQNQRNFTQWSIDQHLIITDDAVTEVHFTNRLMNNKAFVCEIKVINGRRVVEVPNQLLRYDEKITAYIVKNNVTVAEFVYEVVARAKPSDYIGTATEILSYETLREDLDQVIQRIETWQMRYGTASRWSQVNPILALGEPGFVYDTYQLKVGDGVTPWNSLPYISGETGVEAVKNFVDLPSVGNAALIYRVINERTLYQYNATTGKYESLGGGIENIEIIHGGNA